MQRERSQVARWLPRGVAEMPFVLGPAAEMGAHQLCEELLISWPLERTIAEEITKRGWER